MAGTQGAYQAGTLRSKTAFPAVPTCYPEISKVRSPQAFQPASVYLSGNLLDANQKMSKTPRNAFGFSCSGGAAGCAPGMWNTEPPTGWVYCTPHASLGCVVNAEFKLLFFGPYSCFPPTLGFLIPLCLPF